MAKRKQAEPEIADVTFDPAALEAVLGERGTLPQLQAIFRAVKQAVIERASGGELTHPLGLHSGMRAAAEIAARGMPVDGGAGADSYVSVGSQGTPSGCVYIRSLAARQFRRSLRHFAKSCKLVVRGQVEPPLVSRRLQSP